MKPAGRVRVCAGSTFSLVLAIILVLAGVAGAPSAVAAGSAVPAPAATSGPADAPGPCPATLAQSDIDPGMVGTGWTVTSGDTPHAFRVKVLGTLQDGIAPGRDLIVIKVSDLPGAHIISKGGGIWEGMSGSPVYLGGKLAGAISYGFSTGPSRIGGMTPARQMQIVGTYAAAAAAGRRSVRLSATVRRAIARESGTSAAALPALQRLALPFVVTAPSGAMRKRLTTRLRGTFGSIKILSGSAPAASSGGPLVKPPVAGGNLAGVIASGDVTVAAVGTTTSVCGDTVLGFGHPMTGEGRVALGAARASAVTIVDDPAGTPFKLANIGRLFGLLDQDRIAGIRATVGVSPRLIPVTARIRSLDTGRTRTGETSVASSSWLPIVAANHLLYDIVTIADSQGPGTATLTWTIRGTRSNGRHWSLVRTDRVATTDMVSEDAAQMLLDQLQAIGDTDLEKVRFDSVAIQATVSPTVKTWTIRSVQVSRNGGAWRERESIVAHPGDALRFRVGLRDRRGVSTTAIVDMTIPAHASGDGSVVVGTQASDPGFDCFVDPATCPSSFGELLASLRDAPRQDDLVVTMDLTGFDGVSTVITRKVRLDKVVQGSIELPISVE